MESAAPYICRGRRGTATRLERRAERSGTYPISLSGTGRTLYSRRRIPEPDPRLLAHQWLIDLHTASSGDPTLLTATA